MRDSTRLTATRARRGFLKAAAAALCLAVLSPPGARGQPAALDMQVSYQGVLMVTDLAASSGPAGGQITLQWTAPAYTGFSPPLTYAIKVSTVGNILDTAAFNAAQPLSIFSSATIPSPAGAGTLQSMVVTGLSPCGVYYFAVRAADSASPPIAGGWLRSVPRGFNVGNDAAAACLRPPQAPYGVGLSSASYGLGLTSATLRWMPVVRYANLAPFAVSTAPAAGEMLGYSVFRATTPIEAVWSDVADLSTGTLSWTDLASGPQYYYHVRSWNDTSTSDRSVILTPGSRSAYVVAPDEQSYYQFGAADVPVIEGVFSNPDSAYLIAASSRSQDLGTLDGAVMKSIEFDAYMGGRLLSPSFALPAAGLLSLHYDLSSKSQVEPSVFSGAAPSPSNMSVYWFNGTKWMQLYGALDALSQRMTIETKFLGKYQLRGVERAGGFSFNMAGVSNRFLTPNGDGKNDNVVFNFENPKNSPVTAKIFDMRGRVVAGSLPPGPMSNSVMWDGTSGGRAVPGGVYIYQIQAEGQTYSGTLVIVK